MIFILVSIFHNNSSLHKANSTKIYPTFYTCTVRSIHKDKMNACFSNFQEDLEEEEAHRFVKKQNNERTAEKRGQEAMQRLKQQLQEREWEEKKIIYARQAALETEKWRANEVATRPPPKPDPLDALDAEKCKRSRIEYEGFY